MTPFEIRQKIKITEAEIELKKSELGRLHKELFEAEYIPITWEGLKQWLIENRPENDYAQNPIIANEWRDKSYCLIKDGQLRIGAYFHNDKFPRGCKLFVHNKYAAWRS